MPPGTRNLERAFTRALPAAVSPRDKAWLELPLGRAGQLELLPRRDLLAGRDQDDVTLLAHGQSLGLQDDVQCLIPGHVHQADRDLTGDLVATYSWPNTIVDNVTSEGSDDIYYTCLTPRIPEVGTKVTLVLAREEMEAETARVRGLRDRLEAGITESIGDIRINGHPTERLPNTLSLSFRGVDAAALLAAMPGVAASAGAADSRGVSRVRIRPPSSGAAGAGGGSPIAARNSTRLSLDPFPMAASRSSNLSGYPST